MPDELLLLQQDTDTELPLLSDSPKVSLGGFLKGLITGESWPEEIKSYNQQFKSHLEAHPEEAKLAKFAIFPAWEALQTVKSGIVSRLNKEPIPDNPLMLLDRSILEVPEVKKTLTSPEYTSLFKTTLKQGADISFNIPSSPLFFLPKNIKSTLVKGIDELSPDHIANLTEVGGDLLSLGAIEGTMGLFNKFASGAKELTGGIKIESPEVRLTGKNYSSEQVTSINKVKSAIDDLINKGSQSPFTDLLKQRNLYKISPQDMNLWKGATATENVAFGAGLPVPKKPVFSPEEQQIAQGIMAGKGLVLPPETLAKVTSSMPSIAPPAADLKGEQGKIGGVIDRLEKGNYKGKIQSIDYANTGIQLQDHKKLAHALGLESEHILRDLLQVKNIDREGWNLPEDITPEMIRKNIPLLEEYNKLGKMWKASKLNSQERTDISRRLSELRKNPGTFISKLSPKEGITQQQAAEYILKQMPKKAATPKTLTGEILNKEYAKYLKEKGQEVGLDKELEFNTDKLDKELATKLEQEINMRLHIAGKPSLMKPSEVKGVVRQQTGQVKPRELVYLEGQLKMAERVAKTAYKQGKTDTIKKMEVKIGELRKKIQDIRAKQNEPSFGKDWTPEQRKDIYLEAMRSGLIYTDTAGNKHYNLQRFLNRYPGATYEQIKEYIQLLGGNMKNPPKIPITKSLVISEWNQPYKDLTIYQAAPLSGLDPIRAAELVDGKPYGPCRKFIVEPTRQAERQYKAELKKTLDNLTAISKGIKSKSEHSMLIFRYIEKTLTPDDKQKITPIIVTTAEYMEKMYNNLLDRLNEARTRIGKLPIPKRQNYITHLQELSLLDDFFQGFSNIPDDALKNVPNFIKPNSPFFKFALQRLGGPFKEDAIDAFRVYVSKAYPVIYNTEVIRQARALANRLPNNAYKYFTQYIDEVLAMRPVQVDKIIPKPLLSALGWLRNRMGKGAILGNLASVANQPFTLPNIASSAGIKYTCSAALRIFDPAWRCFVDENSRVLQGRIFEIEFDPTMLKKADNALGFLMQLADREMVRIAFGAGFEQAISRGMNIDEAIKFADDMAFKTQSGFNLSELPPAFRSKFATTFLQFQNTVNGGFNYMKFDLGKSPDADRTKWGIFKASLTLIGTFLAMNKLYDALGLPTPVDKWDDLLPMISMAKYGPPVTYSGPLAMLTLFTSEDPYKKTKAWNDLKKSGFMMISGGNQLRKTWEGVEANIKGGKFNKKGKMLFPIKEPGEQIRSAVFGPYGTKAGKKYIKGRYQQKPKSTSGLLLLR